MRRRPESSSQNLALLRRAPRWLGARRRRARTWRADEDPRWLASAATSPVCVCRRSPQIPAFLSGVEHKEVTLNRDVPCKVAEGYLGAARGLDKAVNACRGRQCFD